MILKKMQLVLILSCSLGLLNTEDIKAQDRNSVGVNAGQTSTFYPEANSIVKTNRDDGRYTSTNGFVQSRMRKLKPLLAFDSTMTTPQEFSQWRTEIKNKLAELMKFPIISSQQSPRKLSSLQRNGYKVEKWEIFPQEGSVVPILVLIPDSVSASNPAPAILCYPGSNRSKEELAGEPELNNKFTTERHSQKNNMAKFYVQNGFVAIAIDNPGVAEVSDLEYVSTAPSYHRETFSRYLIDMGWHYMGLSAFNGHQVLNWIRKLDFIDPHRIGLSGHSLGTEAAMVLAVLNPDIKALIFNDFLTDTRRRATLVTKPNDRGIRSPSNGLTHCVPGMWQWFDYTDLLASLAPINLLITEGGVTMDLKKVQKAYEIIEAGGNFTYKYYIKYRNPENRIGDTSIPAGLSQQEWFRYANVDVPNHYFKAGIAIPWVKQVFLSQN